MTHSPFSKLSIRVTGPLLLSLPVLIAVAVLSLIAFWHARAAAHKLANEELVEIHRRIDHRLGDLLSMPQRVNRLNAMLIEQEKLDLTDLRGWREFLYEQANTFEMLSGVLWGSRDGEIVWMFRYPGKEGYEFGIKDVETGDDVREYQIDGPNQPLGQPVGQYAYDPRDRPWYVNAVAGGKATWTEYAWVNEDGSEVTYGLASAQPYYDADGQLLGVLDAEISLHDVSKFLASLEIGQTGLAFLIDSQGNLIANSVGAAVHDADLNRIPASAADHPAIAAAAAALKQTVALDELHGSHHRTISIDGRPHLMIVTPLSRLTTLDWLSVTVVPEEDFLGTIHALGRRSFYFGGVAVLATLGLGVALASLLARPIVQLVNHVRGISGGDLDTQLSLGSATEFVQLSDEINTMTEGLRDRMRMRHSLALAMEVQQSLLPSVTPTLEGLDISGHSTYCDETGGDYYDFLDVAGLSDKSVAIALGDVMGHGVAAAMLMATARGVLRSRCQEPGSLSDLLNHMNQMLVEDTGGERFMTMLLMTIDMQHSEMRWASAGHDPPILYDPRQDDFVELEAAGSLPLGLYDNPDGYVEHCGHDIHSGQIYIISTDGLWDTRNSHDERFGKQRVHELIRRHADRSADEINRQIHTELARFRGPSKKVDDVTFVIVKVGGMQ